MDWAPRTDLLAQAEAARRDGNPLAVHDLAQRAIAAGRTEVRFRYLRALASAQMGDTEQAERLYQSDRLGLATADEDCLALRGRLHKDRALSANGDERHRRFEAASEACLQAYAARGGYFPAINAATMAWAAERHSRAVELAGEVLRHPDLNPARDFYAAASRAEALTLLGRGAEAVAALGEGLRAGRVGLGNRASTCRQLAWLAPSTSLDTSERQALLDAVRPPPVIAFTGQMFHADGEAEMALAEQVDRQIDTLGSVIAYGSLACGSEILVAEAILRRSGELQVVLPCGVDDFVRAFVSPGGAGWSERFCQCLDRAANVTRATRMEHLAHPSQRAYGSQMARGLAQLRAGQLATTAIQLAIWDGSPAAGDVGVASDVSAWRNQGLRAIVIDPGPLDLSVEAAAPVSSGEDVKRVSRAIIFTDYKAYSHLQESVIPTFNHEIMGRIGKVLERFEPAILSRNTWGDAFHAIIADAVTAAEVTLVIAEALRGVRIGDPTQADQEGMRIGLHYGPIYEDTDLITGCLTFYGSEITLAARIEPEVIPGEIYTTQAFAAILATQAPDRYATRYLGKRELAKGYGEAPIYQLERRIKT